MPSHAQNRRFTFRRALAASLATGFLAGGIALTTLHPATARAAGSATGTQVSVQPADTTTSGVWYPGD